ncbi:MAG: antibiotic biosynthesis monooxygenase [Pirellulales bacterium]|nr:antibiotic biosynthesis monooxygenase [Pirellulales bacterium]
MIHVLATIELNPGVRAQFLDEFRRLVPSVLAEEGCIEYGPAIEIATSIPGTPPPRDDVVMVVEKWATIAALEAHLVAPHMNDYRGQVKSLVKATRLQVLESAE